MLDSLTLVSAEVEVVVDLGPGSDIVSVRDIATGLDVMFQTPWHEHAEAVRDGRAMPVTFDPVGAPLETYRGGWQLLCPVAGPPRPVHGAPTTFHGEAQLATWTLVSHTDTSANLEVELFTVPIKLERRLVLDGPTLSITDTLTNLSPVELTVDYVSHPAFAGAFLEGNVTLDTNASTYVADPGTEGSFVAPGTSHSWPMAGETDLCELPAVGVERMAFGRLADFGGPTASASITNHDLGLQVSLAWDATVLPYAWFWQELNWGADWPWHKRARVIAIEPSSTITSGPDRESVLVVPADGITTVEHSLTLEHIKES